VELRHRRGRDSAENGGDYLQFDNMNKPFHGGLDL
jgi:hypothetical protein